ncbi:MAG TPA: hypothetical protein VNF99_12640 [Stellaceae bacterium]|nr:hypothetical protein [Stellaceae bacterium]
MAEDGAGIIIASRFGKRGERVEKILFWRTIYRSYAFVFTDLGRFVRICGAWAVVNTFFAVAVLVSAHWGLKAPGFLALIAWGIVRIAGTTAFAVAWHRLILIGEVPELRHTIRFGLREFRFFFNGLLIGCAQLLAIGAQMLLGYLIANRLEMTSWLSENSSIPAELGPVLN